jgi:cytochrome c oxidase subunit 2
MYVAAMSDRPLDNDEFQSRRLPRWIELAGRIRPSMGRSLKPVSNQLSTIVYWVRRVALVAVTLLATAEVALAESNSIFDPASYNSQKISEIFYLVLAITGLIFVVLFGAIVFFVLRYRTRDDESELEPPQIYGSWPIEVAWTIAPMLIIFVLFLIVIRSVNEQRPERAPADALTVNVVGHQWWWAFEYSDLGFVTANELHVPIGDEEHPRSVFLKLESADVAHSFWVPRLGGKTDLIPNRVNTMWFAPSEAGVFTGQCAEYCGTQHTKMLLRVIVESPREFEQWVENEKKPAVDDPAAAEGRRLFLSLSCASCHTIRGTNASGTLGPDLTHLMSRQTIGAGAAVNDRTNLMKWIRDPHVFKSGCHMPAMKLTAENVEIVVSYLETLR